MSSKQKRVKKPKLYARQNGRCFYCGVWFPIDEMTFEHIIPRSENGTDANANLVLADAVCNHDRQTSKLTRTEKQKLKELKNGSH